MMFWLSPTVQWYEVLYTGCNAVSLILLLWNSVRYARDLWALYSDKEHVITGDYHAVAWSTLITEVFCASVVWGFVLVGLSSMQVSPNPNPAASQARLIFAGTAIFLAFFAAFVSLFNNRMREIVNSKLQK